jgi:glyoxylase-like metal-dependent hydrolase (beta-lactamase superfamily II)
MMHKVSALPNGPWKQNCYVVSDNETRKALIIDPGSDGPAIFELVCRDSLTPIAILNTHAHYDHIGAVAQLMELYSIPFYLNFADAKLLKQANLYKMLFGGKESIVIPTPTHDLRQQSAALHLGGFDVEVLLTPGHTQGSTCLQIGANLFSGDTLLPAGPGRADLPGGDKSALKQSIQLLRNLPTETKVWPGHGRMFELASLWHKLDQIEVAN